VPDVGEAILSSDTEWAGAFSEVFSPQFEKFTVPWISEECADAPGLVTSSIGVGFPVADT
jgi:hypothetical protein